MKRICRSVAFERRQILKAAIPTLICFLCVATRANGDAGPGFYPRGDVYVQVGFKGARPKGDFRATLLSPGTTGVYTNAATENWLGPRNETSTIPDLGRRLTERLKDSNWSVCQSFADPHNGESSRLLFRQVREAETYKLPRQVRLVVYFPSDESIYITNPTDISRRRDRSTLLAVIEPDGTGTLVNEEPTTWIEENYVLQMLVALAATLVIELAVVLLWIAATQRRASAGRVLLIAIAGNLITVPAVWAISFESKIHFDIVVAAVVYAAAEVGAILVEAALYVWLGKFTARSGYLLSFTANCLSFLCGCCLVSFY
jgi:hypothetical protein